MKHARLFNKTGPFNKENADTKPEVSRKNRTTRNEMSDQTSTLKNSSDFSAPKISEPRIGIRALKAKIVKFISGHSKGASKREPVKPTKPFPCILLHKQNAIFLAAPLL